jgi:hypothetical protein
MQDEILMLILEHVGDFKQLIKFSVVCRQWKRVILSLVYRHPLLTSYIQFNKFVISQNAGLIKHLTFSGQLKESCRNNPRLSKSLTNLLTSGVELTTFDISFCKGITNQTLESVSTCLSGLVKLNLSGGGRSDSCIIAILTNCRQHIQELNMSWNLSITDKTLVYIGNNCPKLTILSIAGCHRITDLGIIGLSQNLIKYLDFEYQINKGVASHSWNPIVNGKVHETNRLKSTKLKILVIKYCNLISDFGIQNLVKSCKGTILIES